jgi:hypothetical protein
MDATTTIEEQGMEQARTQELNQDRASQKFKQHRTDTTAPSTTETDLIIFLPLAIIADLMGGLDFTGFGAILVRIIDIPIVLILWLWRTLKGNKNISQNYTYQLFFTFLLEMSPFGIVPAWSAFVLYAYLKDRKWGRSVLSKKSREQRIKNKNK